MQSGDKRYFLFDVPAGVDDESVMQRLGNLIRYPEGIRAVYPWKDAGNDRLGRVALLELDDTAAQLLKKQSDNLFINDTKTIFVDSCEMFTKVWSTIDDDALNLVKLALAEGQEWNDVVGDLQLTKFRHDDGYDCWRIEGSLSEIKLFKTRVARLLFSDDDDSPPMAIRKPKKRRNRNRRPSAKLIDDASPSEGSAVGKISLVSENGPSRRFEFDLGRIGDERGVQAIVNPTDCRLSADANRACASVRAATGEAVYERMRVEAMAENGGRIVPTAAVLSKVGLSDVGYIIHVAVPDASIGDPDLTMVRVVSCYESCLKIARTRRISSISFPPLGIESNVDIGAAASGAVAAFSDANVDPKRRSADRFDVVRFVFADSITMNSFVDIFRLHFDPEHRIGRETEGIASVEPGSTDDRCRLCSFSLTGTTPTKRLKCNHDFHTMCIDQWMINKRQCPSCANL